MKILVAGIGGRARACDNQGAQAQPKATDIYALPGNGGIAVDAVCVPVAATGHSGAVDFAREIKADFAVVTPTTIPSAWPMPLSTSASPPSTSARRPDRGQQVFAKGAHEEIRHPHRGLRGSLTTSTPPWLTSSPRPSPSSSRPTASPGKGVTVAMSRERPARLSAPPCRTVYSATAAPAFVIEEYLEGPEVSVLSFTDGVTLVPMLASMDHKRALDGDEGPNTGGGMGAICPELLYAGSRRVHGEDIPAHSPRHERRGPHLRGCPLLRPNADEGRSQGHRIQLPLRRPETGRAPLLETDLLDIMEATPRAASPEWWIIRWSRGSSCCPHPRLRQLLPGL